MKTIRNTTIAGAAGIAMIAAGSVAAPSQAQAGNFGAALVGGVIAGAIIGAATQPVYSAPAYGTVYCSWQNQFKGYDGYGRAVYHRVQVCG